MRVYVHALACVHVSSQCRRGYTENIMQLLASWLYSVTVLVWLPSPKYLSILMAGAGTQSVKEGLSILQEKADFHFAMLTPSRRQVQGLCLQSLLVHNSPFPTVRDVPASHLQDWGA